MEKKTKTNIKIKCLCLAAILILVAGCAALGEGQKTGKASHISVITGVEISDNRLNFIADGPFAYTMYKSSDPYKIIVELPDVRLGNFTNKSIKSDTAGISEIIPTQKEEPLEARFEILLSSPVSLIEPTNKETALIITIKEETKAKHPETAIEFTETEGKTADIKTPTVKTEESAKEVKQEDVAKQEQKLVAPKAEINEMAAMTKIEPGVVAVTPANDVTENTHSDSEEYNIRRDSVTMRLIIVGSKKDAGEILSELKNGKSFASLAKEKSIDKSRERYGYIENVGISKLKAPLREAVTRLKDGETSGAIKLRDGRYAIVQVIDLSYYRKGSEALKSKDYETAENNLLKHVELNPDTVKARIMLGEIYEERKELEKAERMYKDAISFNPKNEEGYERLGRLYLNQKQYDKANEIYEEGLKYLQGSESMENGIRNIRGVKKLMSKMDNPQKPFTEVKEKVVPTPQEIPPVKPKAVVIPKEKPADRNEVSKKEITDEIKVPRKFVHLRIIVVTGEKDAGEILSEIKNGKPFAFLAKDKSLDEESRDECGYLGKVAVNKLDAPLREIISQLRDGEVSSVIKLKDNRYTIVQIVDLKYYKKGAAAFRAKDFKTAETDLLKHIELNPDAVKARIMLGEIYENREKTEKAIEMYKEALSFDPKHKNAYERLGKAYLYLEQNDKAKEIYEEGLKHIPDAWSLWKGLKTAKMKLSRK